MNKRDSTKQEREREKKREKKKRKKKRTKRKKRKERRWGNGGKVMYHQDTLAVTIVFGNNSENSKLRSRDFRKKQHVGFGSLNSFYKSTNSLSCRISIETSFKISVLSCDGTFSR